MRGVTGLIATLLMAVASPAHGHEIRPFFAGIDEHADGRVELRLKLPQFRSGDVAAIELDIAPECQPLPGARIDAQGDSLLQSLALQCSGGLSGRALKINGFSALVPDGLVSLRRADGTRVDYAVNRDHARIDIGDPGVASPTTTLGAYLPIGIEHVLGGWDHLLFVLCLLLLVRARAPTDGAVPLRPLLATITAFTLAHSLTMALAVLGGLSLPSASVEALIAASILLLAVELSRGALPLTTLSQRQPWLIAFVFGLLHGLGFAGALQQTGLPDGAQLWALLMFNVGVEIGQLLFVASALIALRLLRHASPPSLLRRLPLTMIGSLSAAWFLQRLTLILGA